MSNKFIQKIFSCRNVCKGIYVHKVLTVFGIKIKWRNKIKELETELVKQNTKLKKLATGFKSQNTGLKELNTELNELKRAIKEQTDKIKIIQNDLSCNYNAVTFDLFNLHLKELRQNGETIFHLSAFSPVGNAGDNLLVPALQTSITNLKNINFINKNCRQRLNDNDIYLFNNSKGVIIGGGGLFLKDTNPNKISGWQVPISVEQINRIKVPISLVGVGYNRFRNQEDFDDCFYDNITALISKCTFAGIRNKGSIEALKQYLPKELHGKLKFHPCATSVLSKLYSFAPPPPEKDEKEKFIAVNCAFDRTCMRYGSRQDEIMNAIAKVVKALSNDYKIKYYVFHGGDFQALKYFENNNTDMEIINLNTGLTTAEIIKACTSLNLVIGMRGHAQLIPFGCNTPILSVISHDKLKWFLDDINHPEWGVDVLDKDFEHKLYDTARYILNNQQKIREQINAAQQNLYEITNKNLKYMLEKYTAGNFDYVETAENGLT